MTLHEQILEIWQNIFGGERRFMFFIGFCMITFAVPFLLIWFGGIIMNLYFYLILRKRFPEKWLIIKENKNASYQHYKIWLKGQIDPENPFYKKWHNFETFGKVCLGIWFVIVVIIGMTAIIKKYFL